ncbi:MAG: hypothetical protein OEV01_01330 [Nitrospira sp.]|nr:hypothetical protein [Nitrospira sp.]MDH4302536.1 hypothetical protein [Nitrospira sp.]MDH5193250.1 hypothetical protein [Nitrospira sp.]
MNIQLDSEQWQAVSTATLGDILTDLSERAHARARIVTTILLDHRRITDRDIDSSLLQQSSANYHELVATSATQQEIVESARGVIDRYRSVVATEGTALAHQFRMGMQDLSSFDLWLGKVADVVEIIENGSKRLGTDSPGHAIAGWIEELLAARHLHDTVRMADLLEYEVLPRISA